MNVELLILNRYTNVFSKNSILHLFSLHIILFGIIFLIRRVTDTIWKNVVILIARFPNIRNDKVRTNLLYRTNTCEDFDFIPVDLYRIIKVKIIILNSYSNSVPTKTVNSTRTNLPKFLFYTYFPPPLPRHLDRFSEEESKVKTDVRYSDCIPRIPDNTFCIGNDYLFVQIFFLRKDPYSSPASRPEASKTIMTIKILHLS